MWAVAVAVGEIVFPLLAFGRHINCLLLMHHLFINQHQEIKNNCEQSEPNWFKKNNELREE